MDIALCTDNNYAMPCGVTMISVLENNKDTLIKFHIVGTELKDEVKDTISSILLKYNNASIFFYDIKESFFKANDLSPFEIEYISMSAYTRLFLANILPDNLEKVIYMDCDLIICGNISELWNTNIDKYSIGAVPALHIQEYMPNLIVDLGYSDTYGYINSGMLLINLKYFKEHSIIDKFLSYSKERCEKFKYHDQDIINGTLYDTKLALPIKYNVVEAYYLRRTRLTWGKNEVYAVLNDPVIIHYTSSNKPWLKSCTHPMKGEFLKYKAISPWKDVPLTWGKMTKSDIRKHYMERISRAIGLRNRKYLNLNKLPKSI